MFKSHKNCELFILSAMIIEVVWDRLSTYEGTQTFIRLTFNLHFVQTWILKTW